MATPRRPGGYADRQALNCALRANKQARGLLRQIIQRTADRRGSGWLYPFLAELAQELSVALESLHEMERIRSGSDGRDE